MYIVADVGSTKTRMAGSRDLQTFSEPIITKTPSSYAEGIHYVIVTAKQIAAGEPIDAIAIDLPARFNTDKRGVYKLRYLPDWDGHDVAGDIETALATRVYLENDTMQVGLGEAVFGSGKGASIIVYMTVSTGVNAVRVVNGRIEETVYGYETGFQYLSMGDSPQNLMDLIGGEAIHKRFNSIPSDLGHDHPVWEELARYCAFGLHNTILHWSPERVVLGGSMFNTIGIPIPRVQFHLGEIMKAFPSLPEIVHSSLGDIGGLWGGLARLRQERDAK